MTRWLPYPLATASLLLMWLVLNQSLSPGHLLLGCIFALTGPLVLKRLDMPVGRSVKRPRAVLRLLAGVVVDIVRSNLAVALVVLMRRKTRTSGFVSIPLEMRSPYGLATLACLITATPGTAWVSFNPADGTLLIHVLDLIDDDDWTRIVKQRYERLLMEIFE